MKFTEEQAVEALRAELTNKGRKSLVMSDRTLAKQTQILLKKFANDETGLPDFVADVIEILNTMEGDIRKKNADFVNKWKEDHPITEPQNQDSESNKQNESSELKALMERIAALEADKAEATKRASIAQKKQDLVAKLKESGVKDDEWINTLISKVNLDRDFEIETEAKELLPLYNKAMADRANSVPPEIPAGGNDKTNTSLSDVKALAKQRLEYNKI